uniref:Uncharacterized protein n=1 Tax=Plectus sambesii TaxID=2011161 RepID=A0A914WB29_9BILA
MVEKRISRLIRQDYDDLTISTERWLYAREQPHRIKGERHNRPPQQPPQSHGIRRPRRRFTTANETVAVAFSFSFLVQERQPGMRGTQTADSDNSIASQKGVA